MDDLDNIIELLNTQHLQKHEEKKKQRQDKKVEEGEELELDPQEALVDLPDFNDIYEKRFERMEKKN